MSISIGKHIPARFAMLAVLVFTMAMTMGAGSAYAVFCDVHQTGYPCTTALGPGTGTCDTGNSGNRICKLPSLPDCGADRTVCILSADNNQLGLCFNSKCIDPGTQCDAAFNNQPCLLQDGTTGSCIMPQGQEGAGGGECCKGPNDCDIRDGTCTNVDSTYGVQPPASGKGIVSTLVNSVKGTLKSISETMFTRIAGDPGFKATVSAMITLYIVIYGVLFMFAMVQITVHDFMIRLIKVGIVAILLSGDAWKFFSQTVVVFFNNGTDSIIGKVTEIAVGLENVDKTQPFAVIDDALANAVSSKMAITLLATFMTGPYGPIIGILLLLSLGSFLRAMLKAMWVYVMALVMRTLLFGLAPLFIICILFGRTRHLFDGWLNQIVNACLQPILLFAFFAFFCQLIKASIQQILNLDVCWTAWSEMFHGSPFIGHYWRFAVQNSDSGYWEPFNGIWGWLGPEGADGDDRVSPVDIMLPLTLWVLADLAGRFNDVVLQIAKDISSAGTDLGMTTGSSIFSSLGFGGGSGAARTAGGAAGAAGGAPNASRTLQSNISSMFTRRPGGPQS